LSILRTNTVRLRKLVLAAIAVAALACLFVPGPTSGQAPPSRDQQIQETEKRLQELQKQLEALKNQPSTGGTAVATAEGTLPADWLKAMTWRCIGPATMGGRITAISVYEADPTTYWIATASGGLLKTVNNGYSFEHQFDREGTVSIGDVCVAPSDKNIVWIGTGENNPRNSVSYGDGVYKSSDGGKTWKNMGLKKTFQIGKVVVHPKDPNTVYVGALGRLYGPNEDRGVYKTTDGGATWNKVFYTDDKTGVIDMVMHPSQPDTLWVAMWERTRDGYDSWPGGNQGWPDGYDGYDPVKKWGPTAGIYKTTDAGKNWKKLTKGLPTNQFGRVGLDVYRKDPNVLFAVVDCEKIGMGPPQRPVGYMGFQARDAADNKGATLTSVVADGPADKAGLKIGDRVTAVDGKAVTSNQQFVTALNDKKPGDKVKVKISRDMDEREVEVTLGERPATGTGFSGMFAEEDPAGAKVAGVIPEGAAERAGIQIGDIITKIGDREVKSADDLQEINRNSRAGDVAKVEFTRGSEKKTVDLTFLSRQTGGPGGGFGPGGGSRTRPFAAYYAGQRENAQDQQGPDGFQYGGIYKSTDGGESWTRVNSLNPRPMYFSVVRVDPQDDKLVYALGISQYRSTDGGKTFRGDFGRGVHSDGHALWIDPTNGRHMIIGCDGGFYCSYDRGQNWDHLNHLAIGQFYHVALSTKKPYWVFGGLQDNGSWGGPSVNLHGGGGPVNEDWISTGGGDGYVSRVDQNDPDQIYFESQDGGMGRIHLKTGERAQIRPARRGQGDPPHRFNWNTPYILSNHNSKILYAGGEFVFRSLYKGDNLQPISPEITRTKRGSATALSESPRNADVLWVGTDDGYVWITRNGGKDWTNVTEKVGLPGPRWVATIEASRFVEGRAYVCFDAHRSDDDKPYLYVTEDFGQTWKNITSNLPEFGSTRCLREDVVNQNLLYCGTEFGIWASLNRGGAWSKLNGNLPTVDVHEVAVHPTAGEIVAATHGRSIWILDVSALRQMSPQALNAAVTLYKPNTTIRYQVQPSRGNSGRRFTGQNPQPGAHIYYSLKEKAQKVSVRVVDIDGAVMGQFDGPGDAGLHRVSWSMTIGGGQAGQGGFGRRGGGGGGPPEAGQRGGQAKGGEGKAVEGGGRRGGGRGRGAGGGQAKGGGEQGKAGAEKAAGGRGPGGGQAGGPGGGMGQGRGGGRGGFAGVRQAPPGAYRVILTVDGKEFAQSFRIEGDPNVAAVAVADDNDDQ